jgi:hypothetical protein
MFDETVKDKKQQSPWKDETELMILIWFNALNLTHESLTIPYMDL